MLGPLPPSFAAPTTYQPHKTKNNIIKKLVDTTNTHTNQTILMMIEKYAKRKIRTKKVSHKSQRKLQAEI